MSRENRYYLLPHNESKDEFRVAYREGKEERHVGFNVYTRKEVEIAVAGMNYAYREGIKKGLLLAQQAVNILQQENLC